MGQDRIFLSTDSVGGVWQYSLDLAREYTARGLGVDLVVLGPPAAADRLAEAGQMPGVEVVATDLPLDWTAGDPGALKSAARELAALARRRNAELIHLNSAGLGCTGAWPAPVVATLHSCVATWWQAVKGEAPLPGDFSWRRELVGEALRRARAVIVPSGSFAVAARKVYRDSSPPAVVYNGRSSGAANGQPAAAKNAAVFTCGRLWDEAKNAAMADAAAARLNVPIWAAGPVRAPEGKEIALPNLRLLGELSSAEIRQRLSRSGVFVSTSLYEPFGLGVLEAAQSGCALVLSDIPTFRELWSGAAQLVDPHNPGELAQIVEKLAVSPQQRTEWGRRAQQRAAGFTSAKMAAGTLSIYAQAARQRTFAGGVA